MSDRIIKLLSEEVNLTTPGTFGGAQLLRIKNSSSSTQYSIMVKNGSTTTGSITLYPNEVIFLRKKAAETVESSAATGVQDIRAIVVAFGD